MAKKQVISTSRWVDANKVGQQGQPGSKRQHVGTFESKWTCSSCGHTPIPGSLKVCPSCAHPKDASETYQEPGARGRYLTQNELAEQGVDPTQHLSDETCEYCGGKTKPGTQVCPHCNANLVDVGYTSGQCPNCQLETNELICPACGTATEVKGQKSVAATSEPMTRSTISGTFMGMGLETVVALLLCGFFVVAVFARLWIADQPEQVTVTDVYWQRTIQLEEYKYNERGDWMLPPTADLINSEEQIHHYNDVLTGYVQECHMESQLAGYRQECGQEQSCQSVSVYDYTQTICYDDGTCDNYDVYRTEQQCSNEYVCENVPNYENVRVCQDVPQYIQEPVYQTYYTFNIWEWVPTNPVIAEGHNLSPVWPDVPQSDSIREQNNGHSETCAITLTNEENDSYDYDVSCREFGQYVRGTRWERDDAGILTPAEASEQ